MATTRNNWIYSLLSSVMAELPVKDVTSQMALGTTSLKYNFWDLWRSRRETMYLSRIDRITNCILIYNIFKSQNKTTSG